MRNHTVIAGLGLVVSKDKNVYRILKEEKDTYVAQKSYKNGIVLLKKQRFFGYEESEYYAIHENLAVGWFEPSKYSGESRGEILNEKKSSKYYLNFAEWKRDLKELKF